MDYGLSEDRRVALQQAREMPVAEMNRRGLGGYTPLNWALVRSWRDVVLVMLDRGADVNVHHPRDPDCTPLVYAAGRGWVPECTKILARGNAIGVDRALQCAAGTGHTSTCELLLGAGARVGWVDELGMSALSWAVVGGRVGLVEWFIELGADVRVIAVDGSTPLHSANKPELVCLLVEGGADVNAVDNDGRTPLMHIVSAFNVSVNTTLELLRAGADPTLMDRNGDTVFEQYRLRAPAVRELVRYGIEPSPTSTFHARFGAELIREGRAARAADLQERNAYRRRFAEFAMGAKRPPTLTTRRPMLPHELTTRIGLECEKGLPRGSYQAEVDI